METQSSSSPPSPCSWTKPRCRRRRHRHRAADGSRTGNGGAPGCTCCQQPLDHLDAARRAATTIPDLLEDVMQHIHSLLPLREAARAACTSRQFLRFWRHYPTLIFNQETLAASRQPWLQIQDRGEYVFLKAQQLLRDHSGVGLKTLRLNLSAFSKTDIDAGELDGWLRRACAGRPGIVDLALLLPDRYPSENTYTFPYSLLSADEDNNGSITSSSIRSLYLASCRFHPVPTDGPRPIACSRSLSKLRLSEVAVTGDELSWFLSRCFSLEQLDLSGCYMVSSLKIPRVLQKLKVVWVRSCRAMTAVESDAPNLSTFRYDEGWKLSRFTLGASLETKELDLHVTRMQGLLQYAGSSFPCIAQNLETLVLSTDHEKLKAPVMAGKFEHLKHLVICLGESGEFATGYDFLSLACFLDACVALETFVLRIADGFAWYKKYLIVGKPDEPPLSQSRQQLPEFRHGGLGNLRKATITGFCSAKSLVDLTLHILERAWSSLQSLVLDASPGYDRKRSASDRCLPMHGVDALRDAEKALTIVRELVAPNVPVGVELKVLGPCSRCHAMDAKTMEAAAWGTLTSFWQRQEDGRVALVYVLPRS